MCGNSLQDIHGVRANMPERSFHRMQVLLDTLAFWTGNLSMLCTSDDKAGPKVVDCKSDTPEPAAKPAIEIKEPEMQPGGNGDENFRWS
jgi:hypothetical protein